MKSTVTIVIGDPAESGDPTGIIGIHGNFITKKIQLKLAKQFKDHKKTIRLRKTAAYLKRIKSVINPDFMGMESNNDGAEIIKKLNKLPGLKLIPINTSSGLTEQTRFKGYSMDKPFMVHWLAEQKRIHRIIFPENTTGDMQELVNQINQIGSFTSPNGTTSFKAIRNRHDDLFMALLLCCHIFLVYLNKWESEHK